MISTLHFIAVLILVAMPATLQSVEMRSLEALAEGTNKFAIDFYQALKSKSGNIICSPLSAQIVLAMTYTGANGTTAEEMARVLHLPASKEQVLDGHKALITSLQDPVLKLATRIFIQDSFPLNDNFKSTSIKYFLSDVEGKNFAEKPAEACQEINSWVEDKTNNKIKNLLSPDAVTPDTKVILVNAIHFKANWERKFAAELTKEQPFYITPTESVNVPMMFLSHKFKYRFSEKLHAKICELPYQGNEFSMILIVPEALDGLSDVESKLATLNLTDELAGLEATKVDLQLPKFKIEETFDLTDNLKAMGMATAFSDGADFSGISDTPLSISKVIQKAFVEVNEEGTEAAAATGVVMVTYSLILNPEVICNRPFLFIISNRRSKTILFISRISNFPNRT